MAKTHDYRVSVEWTGNTGPGTSTYRGYERNHVVRALGKADLLGSSDGAFHGDRTRWNPEELLVAALSACHQLEYLHQAACAGVVVTAYTDDAVGQLIEDDNHGGHFNAVTLRPTVTIEDQSMIETADRLHVLAHGKCFIANSVNFSVRHEAVTVVGGASKTCR